MSVCIRIEGFEGKWWQGKTILCIPNKPSSCFRWQRLADLCIHFSINKESGCKDQESKAKTCIPKHRKQGFWWQVSRFKGETYIRNCFKKDYGRQKKGCSVRTVNQSFQTPSFLFRTYLSTPNFILNVRESTGFSPYTDPASWKP